MGIECHPLHKDMLMHYHLHRRSWAACLLSPSFKSICDRWSASCITGKPGECETLKRALESQCKSLGRAWPEARVTAPQVHALTGASRSDCGVHAN